MTYRARHTIVVEEQGDGSYHASEPGVDTVGRGQSPPEAIAQYAAAFMDGVDAAAGEVVPAEVADD